MTSTPYNDLPITFEDVHIHQATLLPSDGAPTKLHVVITHATGRFEVSDDSNNLVVSGRVYTGSDDTDVNKDGGQDWNVESEDENGVKMNGKDVYLELHLRGYNYGPAFQNIKETNLEGITCCFSCLTDVVVCKQKWKIG